MKEKFNPPPKGTPKVQSDIEFYGTAILMSLARIYDALLVQIAQSDDNVAAALQDQHARGAYLFPTIHPIKEDPAPFEEGEGGM